MQLDSDFDMTEVLAEAKAGNTARLGQILMAAYPLLCQMIPSWVACQTNNVANPSDVVMEAYQWAWRSLGNFRGKTPGEFLAWLAGIVRHATLLTVRHLGAKKRGAGKKVSLERDGWRGGVIDRHVPQPD